MSDMNTISEPMQEGIVPNTASAERAGSNATTIIPWNSAEANTTVDGVLILD